jgi:cupin superfamily acireductone dioxygenase involved in methionine salvage
MVPRTLVRSVVVVSAVAVFFAGCNAAANKPAGSVYAVLCKAGDLLSVPANTTHWFDMGTRPAA